MMKMHVKTDFRNLNVFLSLKLEEKFEISSAIRGLFVATSPTTCGTSFNNDLDECLSGVNNDLDECLSGVDNDMNECFSGVIT
jgi:hypothetical protein